MNAHGVEERGGTEADVSRRTARRSRVAELVARGFTQDEIAGELGVGQSTVHRDMVQLRQWWRERAATNLQEAKGKQLAIMEAVQQEAMAAWRSSKRPNQRRTRRQWLKGSPQDENASANPNAEITLVEEDQRGDPRFLEVIVRTSERIGKLLGLDRPDKLAFTTPAGDAAPLPVVAVNLEKLSDAELEKLAAAADVFDALQRGQQSD